MKEKKKKLIEIATIMNVTKKMIVNYRIQRLK